ncbi:MAG: hypothetical protein O2890_08860 [Cyanobacteria bacterium]|nr:hypothetical protein [Cyanobacteriota bacterium]
MAAFPFFRPISLLSCLSGSVVAFGVWGAAINPALAQSSDADPIPPSELRSTGTNTTFTIAAADQLAAEGGQAITRQNPTLAIERLKAASDLYNELSTYYQELAGMFVGIDSRQVSSNRALALEAAQKRDATNYQLALVYRTQNQPELAIPLLMEVLRSQQPTRDLGGRAYQQLFELGFVEAPFDS